MEIIRKHKMVFNPNLTKAIHPSIYLIVKAIFNTFRQTNKGLSHLDFDIRSFLSWGKQIDDNYQSNNIICNHMVYVYELSSI